MLNDMPGADITAAVNSIVADGGEAMAGYASVTDLDAVEAMVGNAMDMWGRIDILVNNAGVLRDKTFAKMSLEDFRFVLDVHLMGSVICTKAVWEIMRSQGYGRIVFTTSSSGLYGNFGQSNYGAAKMGLVGLMQTLALEGEKYDIRVNSLAPSASTGMTQGIMPDASLSVLAPDAVSPAVVFLASRQAPTRTVICAGAGSFERAYVTLTNGAYLGIGQDVPDRVAACFDRISSRDEEIIPDYGMLQSEREAARALESDILQS